VPFTTTIIAFQPHRANAPLEVTAKSRGEEVNMTLQSLDHNGVTWIDVRRPTPDDIRELGARFPFFHPLDLEDCLSETERPKIDEYDNYLFVVMHFPVFDKRTRRLGREEVDIFVGRGFLVTLSGGNLKPLIQGFDDCQMDAVIRRQFMGRGSYYLLYMLIDDLVDYCFPIVDKENHNIEAVEQRIFEGSAQKLVREISEIRRNLINFRGIIKPQMRIITSLERKDWEFLKGDLDVYWGDVSDHTGQIWERLDDMWEVVEGLSRTLDSLTSHRINEVMKILTIFSVIMLPLSVISGIYGMNLAELPLADYRFSFVIVMAIMGMVVAGMLIWFKREDWI
jgi:magnesium transporter